MSELTDFELIKEIAAIEGVYVFSAPWNKEVLLYNSSDTEVKEYNPLTNKALLWDLMVKHKHDLDMDDHFMYVKDSDIPRAILTAIVEANNE